MRKYLVRLLLILVLFGGLLHINRHPEQHYWTAFQIKNTDIVIDLSDVASDIIHGTEQLYEGAHIIWDTFITELGFEKESKGA